MSPKKCTTIYLTVASESDPMSVDNNDDKLVFKIAPIETSKPSCQPYTATSYYSSYTPRITSTSALSLSVELHAVPQEGRSLVNPNG